MTMHPIDLPLLAANLMSGGQITCNPVCVDVYRNIYAVDGVVNKAQYVVCFCEPWLSKLMCM